MSRKANMTPPPSTEPMYLISESELGRIKSVIIEDATHGYQTGFFERIRARGPVQQAPADDPMRLWKNTRVLAEIESLTCSKCDEEQKDRCNQGHHCLRSHKILAEYEAALIAQEREKWEREQQTDKERCRFLKVSQDGDFSGETCYAHDSSDCRKMGGKLLVSAACFRVLHHPQSAAIAAQAREDVLKEAIDRTVWLNGHGIDDGKPLVALNDVQKMLDTLRSEVKK